MNQVKFASGDILKQLARKPFRLWFTKQYEEYKLEKEHLGETTVVTAAEYLRLNKGFLRKQYRKHRNGN